MAMLVPGFRLREDRVFNGLIADPEMRDQGRGPGQRNSGTAGPGRPQLSKRKNRWGKGKLGRACGAGALPESDI